MFAIEVAVGIDHFRLKPQAKLHAELFDAVYELVQTIGEDLVRHPPIAKPGGVMAA